MEISKGGGGQMPHDILTGSIGHNKQDAVHLHSHITEKDQLDDLKDITSQFIEGFLSASDKMSFMRLAGVPLEITPKCGEPKMKLVDVQVTTEWQVGTASPSFGSKELSYLPFPGGMIKERTNMNFVYVSINKKHINDLRSFLRDNHSTEK